MNDQNDQPAPEPRRYAFFFDVDGTLAEIQPRPELVFIPPSTLAALERLHAGGIPVAVISGRPLAQLDALLQQARGMRTSRDAAAAAIASARDSLTLNPRAPRHRAELAVLERSVATLTPIVTQAVGMTRAFHERYDESLRSEPAIAAIAEQLSRAAHDVRFAPGRDAATAPDSAGLEPAALTRPLALVTPSSDHWILVGSMMVDLLRIHHSLVEEN